MGAWLKSVLVTGELSSVLSMGEQGSSVGRPANSNRHGNSRLTLLPVPGRHTAVFIVLFRREAPGHLPVGHTDAGSCRRDSLSRTVLPKVPLNHAAEHRQLCHGPRQGLGLLPGDTAGGGKLRDLHGQQQEPVSLVLQN